MEKKSYDGLLSAILIIGFMVISIGFGYYSPKLVTEEEAEETQVVEEPEVTEDTIVRETDLLTNDEALEIGNKLYDYATKNTGVYNDIISNDYDAIINVDTTSLEYYNNIDKNIEKFVSDILEIKKNFTDDFKWALADDNYINDFVSYIMPGGRGSDDSYSGNTLSVKSISEDLIVFNSTEKYCTLEGEFGSMQHSNDCEEKVYEFIIQRVDGSWKIKQFTLAY